MGVLTILDAGDSIAIHISNIDFIVKQLKDMGETIIDDCVITQVLRNLPRKYRGFTMAWNLMKANLKTMATLTAFTGRCNDGNDGLMMHVQHIEQGQ